MNAYLIGGFALAATLVLIHLVSSFKNGDTPKLDSALFLILGAVGVGTGLKVVVLAFTSEAIEPLSEDDRTYLVIGGFATIWVSILAISKSLRE